MMSDIIILNNVSKQYGEKEGSVHALKNISFSIKKGEFVAVVGASGSGKSTLLNLLGGLDSPTAGNIVVQAKDITNLNRRELTIFRNRNIGFIFQNYSLLPVLNAYDNIALPRVMDKGSMINKEKIREIMQDLGIWDKRTKYPNELSGGQQQRVAIGRALITNPALILADEPTGNLDSKTAMEVMMILKNCNRTYRQTIIMVTHNELMAQLCDRTISLSDGIISKEQLC